MGLTMLNVLDMDSSYWDKETVWVFEFPTQAIGKTLA